MKFKRYLKEGYEIFGYDHKDEKDARERSPNFPTSDRDGDRPIKGFNLEYAVDLIASHSIGEKQPLRLFFDQVIWGEGVGSIRLRFGTKFDVIIEKLTYDLKSNPLWVTKKVFSLNKNYFSSLEEVVADEIYKELIEVDDNGVDGPISNYNEFERLIKSIAFRTNNVVNDPLFFDSIKKLSDDEYIIVFGCRGGGVQSPDQQRVEQTQIHMKYHSKRGVIQCIQTNVESSLKYHDWTIMPSDFELYFMPSQSRDEIVNVLATIMKWF